MSETLWRRLAGGLACCWAVVGMLGCRLYEPPRYERLVMAPGAAVVRVLMVGNSLTYYNDLPGLLQQMSAREAAPIYIEQVTFPLRSLKGQWEVRTAARRIAAEHWNYVVLQDYSRKPVTNPDESETYFLMFDRAIREVHGRTILFQNWTRRGMEKDYEGLLATYREVQGITPALLAPIGAAWRDWGRRDVPLLLDDRHPTDAGSYLAACVLYDVIYRKKSGDLPLDLKGPTLAPEVLRALRKAADEAVAKEAAR